MSKLKILMHYPDWQNRWEPYIIDVLSKYDLTATMTTSTEELHDLSKDKDILISMWANGATGYWSQTFPEKKIITYLRRFELWSDTFMSMIDFNNIDAIVWVNSYIAEKFNQLIGDVSNIKQYMIPNGIDLSEWDLRNGSGSPYKIALVASMKHVKNIPLAAQILACLPPAYSVHHIGLHTENFQGELFSYVDALGLNGRWHWEPKIPREQVQDWLKDKGMILNPSINEGNPNCLIEAMAMGIKPIIHAWPGAYEQFPAENIFRTVDEACAIIKNGQSKPGFYRKWVQDRFSVENFQELNNVIRDVTQ